MAYATVAELAVFMLGEVPGDALRQLDRASELIDDHTRTAVYEHDTDGFPTEAKYIAAFMKATCAQVQFWMAGDEEDDVLGPVEWSLAIGGTASAPSGGKSLVLAPRAARILRAGGLYRGDPVTL